MQIKDESVIAAAEAIKNGRPFRHAETARAALEAALPHLSQGAVKVKPLEWRQTVDGYRGSERREQWAAETPWGTYYIWHYQMPDDEAARGPKYTIGAAMSPYAPLGLEYDSLAEAKAAAQADYERRIMSALSPAPVGVMPTHRHKKRGTEYVLLGIGKMQAEYWEEREYTATDEPVAGVSVDMREVVIYRSVDDGSLWVRPREEFEDGRFEGVDHD